VSDDKLVRLFADGSTIVLQGLHRVWPPIIQFCQQLAAELGHPVQANAYVTPPQNQGFSDHYDVHDVFVLQLEGEKRWRIHPPVYESPLRNQPWTDRKDSVERRAAEPPSIEAVLRPGDCLYLPRGFLHAATALGGTSIHLTIGVHSWTRYALAEQLVDQVLRAVAADPGIRGSLRLALDLEDSADLRAETEQVRQLVAAALASADLDQVRLALRRAARDTQRAAPVRPLRQLRDATGLQPGTMINLRQHLAASLDQVGDRTVLRSRADDLVIAEDEVAPVKSLLAAGSVRAEDLGLELARRLIRAGVAVVE
jgi:ribosomal protein L16 Arg81 hydroxylase